MSLCIRQIDNIVIFRRYTKDLTNRYDVRSNRNDYYYNYNRFKEVFRLSLYDYCLKGYHTKLRDMEGFWRLPDPKVYHLSGVVFYYPGKCSCEHKNSTKWCPHEHLFQYIKYYINSRGLFDDSIGLHIMKFLAN